MKIYITTESGKEAEWVKEIAREIERAVGGYLVDSDIFIDGIHFTYH